MTEIFDSTSKPIDTRAFAKSIRRHAVRMTHLIVSTCLGTGLLRPCLVVTSKRGVLLRRFRHLDHEFFEGGIADLATFHGQAEHLLTALFQVIPIQDQLQGTPPGEGTHNSRLQRLLSIGHKNQPLRS